ncbi:hypothetical protein E3T55_01535 [Cryobacterium frigoriphilum]|uniref:SbsA Ig-like domain-containing protein n=1 Tax=Cryobacterium frigoriphilum TaxID=1259150 RepID=A0A4R9AAV1_9MICO|nr:hypothetical protein [Cryobacterium frigoriphilum]TFD55134.1 hypothetical protein E3T55_01535 [Cryobacterium frigoriphilum]
MSTEPPVTHEHAHAHPVPTALTDAPRHGSARSFRLALWSIVTVLTLVCAGLVAVNLLNGPRLLGFDVDPAGVVASANQRLVLETNQQLDDVTAAQVTLVPNMPISVETSTDSVVILFPQPLAYNTDYTVSVTGVSGSSTGQSSDFEVSFETEEPELYFLSRGAAPDAQTGAAKQPDRVLRTLIGSNETEAVFEAPYIQEFVPIGAELAVVTLNADLSSTLTRVDSDGVASALTLPGGGAVQDLEAAAGESLLGFRFTSTADAPGPVYENHLFLFNLATGVADPVLGLDAEPVQAIDWGFMPGRAELVAQLYDTTMLLVNPLLVSIEADGALPEPIPLGQFSALTAFAPDGRRIAVSDSSAQFVLDLSEGTEDTLTPESVVGTTRYTAGLRFLAGGDGFVQRLSEFDPDTQQVRQNLTLVSDGVERVVYAPSSGAESIVGFSVSPNDQYLAVQIVPNRDTSVSDGYPFEAQSTDATTLFVNIATGQITRSVVGFAATW